ncbi:MAG TPA: MBL fold metallo-hydrolase, partial [Candidatus Nanopelagicales bacterium]|nr:MBL fold metallo-hydrolase [Candidatus Nanopelagicales bacterium]
DEALFRETSRRVPGIDLALMPIAPVEPRDFMASKHVDAVEAVQAAIDLGARWMVPVHFDTFVNSLDEPGDALRQLRRTMTERHLDQGQIQILAHGEQRVLIPR